MLLAGTLPDDDETWCSLSSVNLLCALHTEGACSIGLLTLWPFELPGKHRRASSSQLHVCLPPRGAYACWPSSRTTIARFPQHSTCVCVPSVCLSRTQAASTGHRPVMLTPVIAAFRLLRASGKMTRHQTKLGVLLTYKFVCRMAICSSISTDLCKADRERQEFAPLASQPPQKDFV